MSTLIRQTSSSDLTNFDVDELLARIADTVRGRALAAYVFGSVATGTFTRNSDIDLIIIAETSENFAERGLKFKDLFDTYPAIDLLVYTPDEFSRQLADSSVGFWKSVRLTMRQLL